MSLNDIQRVDGLPAAETDMLAELLAIWSDKLQKNITRNQYYEAKNSLKDLGISIPPSLQHVETVVGWPAKAVDVLAVRSRFDGYIFRDGENELMNRIVKENNLLSGYGQAVNSELIDSCAFATVSKGDEDEGEPPAIISFYNLMESAAVWDKRRKRVKYGLTVIDTKRLHPNDAEESPIWVNLYTDTDIWEIKRNDDGTWSSRRNPHSMGRPMMVALRYRPTLKRPFGKSRISSAVRSITDSAVREALRSEVSAEFFTAPQKYLLGASDDTFEDKDKWEAYIGTIFAVSKDEDGDKPTYGQLPQGSMSPHTEYMRSLASRFSGETAVPVSELGVVSDNPSSAEAIYAAKESLVIEAEHLNELNGDSLVIVGKMALACAQDKALRELDENELTIEARFKNPAMPSIVSQADAITKVVSVLPWMAESQVTLEEFGFNGAQITRLLNDKRKAEGKALLMQETASQEQGGPTAAELGSVLKDYTEGRISSDTAISLMQSAGLPTEEAMRLLGEAKKPTLEA